MIRSGSHGGNVSRSVGVEDLGGPELPGQLASPLAGLDRDDRPDAPGHQRGDGQGPDGPGPDDHDPVAGDHAGAGDAVQGHGQRLGQCGLAGGQARGQAEEGGLPDQHVAGEGPVVAVDHRALPVLALRRLALEAPAAPSAPGRGAPDDQRTELPPLDVGPQGHDGSGELVAGHQALLAPPVEEHVDVGPADAAVVHLHQHLVGGRAGHRPVLHHHHPGAVQYGRRHRLGQFGHHATPPDGPPPAGPEAGGSRSGRHSRPGVAVRPGDPPAVGRRPGLKGCPAT